MYVPKHFEEMRSDVMHDLIERYPLATLVVAGADGLDANHIPLLLDAERGVHGVLLGHVARANRLWQVAGEGIPALAVFHGPDAYVSPSHYATKRESGKVVPTWNYAVVHARGRVCAIDDLAWIARFVRRLTDRHEAGGDMPWAVDDAPAEFVEAQLRAIVGIEVAIESLTGKFKLSQNRNAADYDGVANGLAQASGAGAAAVAALMNGVPKAE